MLWKMQIETGLNWGSEQHQDSFSGARTGLGSTSIISKGSEQDKDPFFQECYTLGASLKSNDNQGKRKST